MQTELPVQFSDCRLQDVQLLTHMRKEEKLRTLTLKEP